MDSPAAADSHALMQPWKIMSDLWVERAWIGEGTSAITGFETAESVDTLIKGKSKNQKERWCSKQILINSNNGFTLGWRCHEQPNNGDHGQDSDMTRTFLPLMKADSEYGLERWHDYERNHNPGQKLHSYIVKQLLRILSAPY